MEIKHRKAFHFVWEKITRNKKVVIFFQTFLLFHRKAHKIMQEQILQWMTLEDDQSVISFLNKEKRRHEESTSSSSRCPRTRRQRVRVWCCFVALRRVLVRSQREIETRPTFDFLISLGTCNLCPAHEQAKQPVVLSKDTFCTIPQLCHMVWMSLLFHCRMFWINRIFVSFLTI